MKHHALLVINSIEQVGKRVTDSRDEIGIADIKDDIVQAKKKLKALKGEKGSLSKRIGLLKKSGESAETEISDLSEVCAQIALLTKNVKLSLKSDVNKPPNSASKGINCAETSTNPSAFTKLGALQVASICYFDGDKELAEKINLFADLHPIGTIYHKTFLYDFITSTFDHQNAFLVAIDSKEVVIGLLPLVQLNSRLFGNFVVSVPYFNYGGVLANNNLTETALLEEAKRWQKSINASHIEYRHKIKNVGGLPARTDKVSFVLQLPMSTEDLWTGFKSKLRSQIKRSTQSLAEIKIGKAELLDQFYQVFSRNMRDLGTPVYGREFFNNALTSFGDSAYLVIVTINQKPVGCAFLLGNKEILEIPWASTLKEYNPMGINMFMYWEVLKFAIEKKYKAFDFGRCTVDCGTYKFKKQWGAEVVPFYWHYQLPEGEALPQLNPNNPKFKLLVAIWKCLPVFLTKLIGPHIVKYLP